MAICPDCFKEGFLGGRCKSCGYVGLAHEENHMLLSPGMILNNRYTVGRTLGAGGFGVTYLVLDNQNGQRMAAKEYLPASFAVRDGNSKRVYASGADNEDIFQHGLDVFDREAESLRLFLGNPSVVQVTDSFRQNGTSYYIMEFLDGVNLKALSRTMGGRLDIGLAIEVVQSVGATLSAVHQKGMLHRDVSPENIFVTKQGLIKLIDFGATRFFVGERSRSLSVILKPGFAPPEQYSSKGNQGPWTDVYALGATFLNIVSGTSIPDAPDRLAGADLEYIFNITNFDARQKSTVEKALEVNYRQRYQTVEEFLADLSPGGAAQMPMPASAAPALGRQHPAPSPASPAEPVSQIHNLDIRGTPYVQMSGSNRPGDKWVLPANMDMTIGRASEKCNIIIDDTDISRVHCILRYNSGTGMFTLTDMSSNGTYLKDGSRLQKGAAHNLAPGAGFNTAGKYVWEVGVE